jgi:hypothetical protein
MAFLWKLRCPDCSGTFKWPGDQELPAFCPLCQAPQTIKADDDICLPFIRSAATKAIDNVYRDMERGSEVRAQAAADILGVSASDVSDLKITNIRDAKYGEQSFVPVTNDVTRMMDATPKTTGFQANGAMLSPDVQSGPNANSGARMRTSLQKMHAKNFGHHLVSDRPGLETEQPGYRRRG